VTVGVVDSVYDPPWDFGQYNSVERRKRRIDSDEDCTSPHGAHIARILAGTASDPNYQFYQIADMEGEYNDRDLVTAIVWAADYGVDVLNLSLGSDHISNENKDCDMTGASCAVAEAAEYAADKGVVLVSAVGNQSLTESVCCPALSDYSVAVGGCVAKCTASIQGREGMIGPDIKPPGAIWVDRPDDKGLSEPVCRTEGCGPGESCESNRVLEEWSGNPTFVSDTPDTLAPAYYPTKWAEGPVMQTGTSFAAPIVTATILNVLMIIRNEGKDAQTSAIRKCLQISGEEIDNVPVGVLNAFRFANELMQSKGLPKIQKKTGY
jgi:subtilisin family serine protease